ncbi:ABC transporter ATP-binding protein [Advenella sp. S44]|uniref:ABC transporter ATP-binding protein n=1 Tax=Advenella sp. S44 TaxID=1982755 RepID=UPI000C2B1BFE|nr:ABC transporter ATP-binding protein [Advenella sp. S44]PJX25941.1 ABC transporter ATP-binding protein [Advenella sp. S44]
MTMPLLEAKNLTRKFGALIAVNNVSLQLRQREIHAVIGTNGAGKSTLTYLLSGELPLSGGQVQLRGKDVSNWSQPARSQAGLGRSYQRNNIFLPLSVRENCRLAAQAKVQKPWQFWSAAQQCRRSLEAANYALEQAGLGKHAATTAANLSHGQKRQLEVAMCLAQQPDVLLLDEPLAGMGAEESDRMLGLLHQLKKNLAILLIEHDMDAVFAVADRLTVMVNGSVLASGLPDAIRNNAAVQTAYLGEGDHTADKPTDLLI